MVVAVVPVDMRWNGGGDDDDDWGTPMSVTVSCNE